MLRATVAILWSWSKLEDEIHALRMEKQKDRRLEPWWDDGVPVPALHHLLPDFNVSEGMKKKNLFCLFFKIFPLLCSWTQFLIGHFITADKWKCVVDAFSKKDYTFWWTTYSKSHGGIFLCVYVCVWDVSHNILSSIRALVLSLTSAWCPLLMNIHMAHAFPSLGFLLKYPQIRKAFPNHPLHNNSPYHSL